jgi:hypothetical protein
MPRIIYIDNVADENGNLLNTTPAATFATTDLSTILDNIANGSIPCGTGKPLPVNWGKDDKAPWDTNGPNSDGNWNTY